MYLPPLYGYSNAAVSSHLLWGDPLWLDHFLSEVPVMEIVKFHWLLFV